MQLSKDVNPLKPWKFAKTEFTKCKDCVWAVAQPNSSIQFTCMFDPPTTAMAQGRDLAGNVQMATISMRPTVTASDFCSRGLMRNDPSPVSRTDNPIVPGSSESSGLANAGEPAPAPGV